MSETKVIDIVAFAEKCGVVFTKGEDGYERTSKDYPNVTVIDYRTKRQAAQAWFDEVFGSSIGKALVKELGVKFK